MSIVTVYNGAGGTLNGVQIHAAALAVEREPPVSRRRRAACSTAYTNQTIIRPAAETEVIAGRAPTAEKFRFVKGEKIRFERFAKSSLRVGLLVTKASYFRYFRDQARAKSK